VWFNKLLLVEEVPPHTAEAERVEVTKRQEKGQSNSENSMQCPAELPSTPPTT